MDCRFYKDGHCTKWRKNGACKPSSRKWFDDPDKHEMISVERMCTESSIFGNYYIAITKEELKKIEQGEVLMLRDEYGFFVGLKEGEMYDKNTDCN